MDKQTLFDSAEALILPSGNTSESLEMYADICAKELTAVMHDRSELQNLIGEGNEHVMEINHHNHFKYIASLVSLYDPKSFVETVIWVFRTYRAQGFQVDYWRVMLPQAKRVLKKHLTDGEYAEAVIIYDWLFNNISAFATLSEEETSFYEKISPMHEG